MRIAQVAPLYESVPPRAYGATERVVSFLTEALTHAGHRVTLFATGDSTTAAELVPICPRGLWRDVDVWDTLTHHVRQLEAVAARAADFDVVHFHGDPFHFPLARRLPFAHLTTMHGQLLAADHGPLFEAFPDAPLVSISDNQRRPLPHANWRATVHHGMPLDALQFHAGRGDYLLFLGRMMGEKRPDRAIEIARRAGLPLKMAAKVHPGEVEYFRNEVEPMLRANADIVEYLGEVGGAQRAALIGNARALLFPVDWPEPFGMVMIEAMASGTPVVAWRRGAVPEVLDEGETGFIVEDVDAAVDAVARVASLDRRRCRAVFERRFDATRMAADYVAVYEGLLAR
ncbi:glycosyltransferase family 4 protein [Chitinasiproducens palmae]|uniref:Glycosyltransferase involved in cell wall bisynthesis n=1 Tax=Chitinasiproducens palmae TaxID=1770053 RepID=A0A1H2PL39_9BURK|nr:glycosyltransferase family 4 protein [Chitinasiproducens palmae]SDV46740.1 Glycosyltransferase involved in cell wall bisynthesis [Chitinasiproducens palmae]